MSVVARATTISFVTIKIDALYQREACDEEKSRFSAVLLSLLVPLLAILGLVLFFQEIAPIAQARARSDESGSLAPAANQNVSGTIITHTTWSSATTYIVIGNLGIAPGISLTIQPGMQIKFNGNYNLSVGGTLIARGLPAYPISMLSNTDGSWGRIYFDSMSGDAVMDAEGNYLGGSVLEWVSIQSASQGINCNSAAPFLAHVQLRGG